MTTLLARGADTPVERIAVAAYRIPTDRVPETDGTARWDATTYFGIALLVLTVAAAASFLPSARASRLDPMRVLRDE